MILGSLLRLLLNEHDLTRFLHHKSYRVGWGGRALRADLLGLGESTIRTV